MRLHVGRGSGGEGEVSAGGWKPCGLQAGMSDSAQGDRSMPIRWLAPSHNAVSAGASCHDEPPKSPVIACEGREPCTTQAYPADCSMVMLSVHNTSAAGTGASWLSEPPKSPVSACEGRKPCATQAYPADCSLGMLPSPNTSAAGTGASCHDEPPKSPVGAVWRGSLANIDHSG